MVFLLTRMSSHWHMLWDVRACIDYRPHHPPSQHVEESVSTSGLKTSADSSSPTPVSTS